MSDERPGPSSKPSRPRDELGRPLPWGSENRLPMEDFDALPLGENHRLAIRYWNARSFFPAHEAWESCWKQAKGTGDEELFKGLSQLGAGYVHWGRENHHGAKTLLRRGAGRVREFGDRKLGLDLAAIVAAAEADADRVEAAQEAGDPMPTLDPPHL